MKRTLLPALAGLTLLSSTVLAASDTLILTPEDDTVVQEYVTTQKVQPVEAPKNFTVTVGESLPDTIQLQPIESPKLKKKYSYAVIGKQRVVVEPTTRKIIKVYQ